MENDSPFNLTATEAYANWKAFKLATQPGCLEDLMVDVEDPLCLKPSERERILRLCRCSNAAVYRSPSTTECKQLPRTLGAQLGLSRLDANWLADEDGITSIAVRESVGDRPRGDFIPYTDHPIRWHTDGYYHPQSRHIEGLILHCVRAAAEGGVNRFADHDRIYMSLRDANPEWIAALMEPDAMTIPERTDENGVARPAQIGPVFYLNASGALQMRYTARTRSILWKDDPLTRSAVAALEHLLAQPQPWIFSLLLRPGMGIVCNNVPHDRSGFVDDATQPRLLYRARFLNRVRDELAVPFLEEAEA